MSNLGWVRPYVKFPGEFYRPQGPLNKPYPPKFTLPFGHVTLRDQGEMPDSSICAVLTALEFCSNPTPSTPPSIPSVESVRLGIARNMPEIYPYSSLSLTAVIRYIQTYGYNTEDECTDKVIRSSDSLPDDLAELALKRRNISFANISLSGQIFKGVLLDGRPIVMGSTIYETFFDRFISISGSLQSPQEGEMPLTGASIVLIGWDDANRSYRFRGSFGEDWGDSGYGWIPYTIALSCLHSDDHYACVTNP